MLYQLSPPLSWTAAFILTFACVWKLFEINRWGDQLKDWWDNFLFRMRYLYAQAKIKTQRIPTVF